MEAFDFDYAGFKPSNMTNSNVLNLYYEGNTKFLDIENKTTLSKSGENGIIDRESARNELEKAIADGKLRTKLDKDAQSAHKKGSEEYNKRIADGELPSYTELSHMEIQKIINTYSLTGIVRKGKDGQYRETITVKDNIGMFGDLKTKKYIPTNRATIHYSKKGTHLIPSAPLGGD